MSDSSSDSTDFAKQPPPPVLPSVILSLLPEKGAANQGAAASTPLTPGDSPERTLVPCSSEHHSEQLQVEEQQPQQRQEYYCGVGVCRPRWMQKLFANAIFFTVLLCAYAFIEGAIVSGFTSVVLSTIEKRYNFSSLAVGMIAVTFDATVVVSVIFVSYFGGKSHKPRWLGVGLIIQAIGAFIFATPQFYAPYQPGSSDTVELQVCLEDRNTTLSNPSNNFAYALFLFGNIFVGVGAAPLFTIGTAYLDEINYPKHVSVHMGIFYAMSVVGPAFGYGVGSGFLSVYVDPWKDTHLTSSDPSWVGAWWLSFVFAGCLSLLLSVPFFLYPRWLPNRSKVQEARAKEMAKTYSSEYRNEDNLTIMVKTFPRHIKHIMTNISFLFVSGCLAAIFIVVSGLVAFAPKYLESQFGLTASVSGIIVGAISIPSAGAGTVVGALLVACTKVKDQAKGKRSALYSWIIIMLVIPSVFVFLLGCPTAEIAGITIPYHNGSQSGPGNSSCAAMCRCSTAVYEPVCGNDSITYFSACTAGCQKRVDMNGEVVFEECLCVAEVLSNTTYVSTADQQQQQQEMGSFVSVLSELSIARSMACDNNCNSLGPFLAVLPFALFLIFMVQIPTTYMSMRVVADEQRALALGVQSVLWRLFGSIPGPLLFGVVFDSTCIYPPTQVGQMGNCWVYDNEKLSIYALVFSLTAVLLAAIFAGLAWFTYPKNKTVKGDEESKNESNQSESSRASTTGSDTPLSPLRPRPDSLPVRKANSTDELLQSTLTSDSPTISHELRARSVEIETSP